jgi:hypothetical protein
LFFFGTIPSQEIEGSCIYVLGVSILPLSMIFTFYLGTVPTVWYFLFFILFQNIFFIFIHGPSISWLGIVQKKNKKKQTNKQKH